MVLFSCSLNGNWEADAAIAERQDPIIDEIRNPDPEANVIDV